MRGDSILPRPVLFLSARILSPLLLSILMILAGGCAGRYEYSRGLALDLQGDLRGAYRSYHEAFRRSGKRSHLEARKRIGASIAGELRREAQALERIGRLEEALEVYLRALEFDPGQQSLVAGFLGLQERILRLEEGLLAAQAKAGTWESSRILLDLNQESPGRPDLLLEVRKAVAGFAAGSLRRLLAPEDGLPERERALLEDLVPENGVDTLPGERGPEDLLEGTLGEVFLASLPQDPAGLERRLAQWWDLQDRLESLAAEDSWAQGGLGLEGLLAPRIDLARTASRAVEQAFLAERSFCEASVLEKVGDPEAALAAYSRAFRIWPYWPKIRDGIARMLDSFQKRATISVLQAMARKDWAAALDHLSRLERLDPNSSELQRRSSMCRREIHDALLQEGVRMRERGLLGNSLCTFRRIRDLGLGGSQLDDEILRLEEALFRKARSEVQLECSLETRLPAGRAFLTPQAAAGGPRGQEGSPEARDPEDASCLVEKAIREELERRRTFEPPPADPSTPRFPGGPRSPFAVQVSGLSFEYRERRESAGSLESRFVSDFREVENPEWIQARNEHKKLSAEIERIRKEHRNALPERRSEAAVRLEIAEAKARRTRANMERIPRTMPALVWKSDLHPVTRLKVEAILSGRIGIEGEEQPLRVDLDAEDREVLGNLERGVLPSRPDLPARGEALHKLASRMAREVTRRVEDRLEARWRRFLQDARERISEDSYEAAVENLVLFLYAQPRHVAAGSEGQEARELLHKITGCRFPEPAADSQELPGSAGMF